MTTGERIKALRPENSNYESIILIGEKMAEAASQQNGSELESPKKESPRRVAPRRGYAKRGTSACPQSIRQGHRACESIIPHFGNNKSPPSCGTVF